MSIFARYLGRRFLTALAFALLALVALALTLDLMEQGDKVLAADPGGIPGMLRYSALRLPDFVAQMLLVATLLAMLLAIGQFLRHSELVALWSSGVSPFGLILAMLPIVAILGILNFLNNDSAVPETRLELRDWGFGESRRGGLLADAAESAWLLSGRDIVRAPRQANPDASLNDVTIFRRDAEGRLTERIDAQHATRMAPQSGGDEDAWLLSGVTLYSVAAASTEELPSLRWRGQINLDALPLVASDGRELRSSDLMALIENDGYGQRPTDRFRTLLHERVASFFLPALMAFLVIALAQRFRRTGAFGALMLSSLAIGFLFFVLDGLCLALGEAGWLPAWFAAWSAKLALACLIGTFLLGREA